MKKALITGISGFVGSHLAQYLVSKDVEVTGYAHPDHPRDNIGDILDKIVVENINLLDRKNLRINLKRNDFNYVFHLAAFSSAGQSFAKGRETLQNNIFAELNILECLAELKSKAKILIVGSCDEYGNVPEEKLPIVEETTFFPASPYAVSKIAQDMMGFQFFLNYKLNIIRVRPFNHIGPRQSQSFVIPSFASQIARLELQKGGKIKVGNLQTWRDFTDVRDMVKAYLLALDKGIEGEVYNIGSGNIYKIEDMLEELLSLSNAKIDIVFDKSLIRKGDIKKIYSDSSKFKKQTGWQVSIPISKTLFDTIEYERNKLKN